MLQGSHRLTIATLAVLTSLSSACNARDSRTKPGAKADVTEPAAVGPADTMEAGPPREPDGARKEPSPGVEVEVHSPRTPPVEPPAASVAYFQYATGIYRLDDEGWTRVFAPADRLLRGGDGAVYVVDRVGVHRLAGKAHLAVHVIAEDGASKPLFGAIEHVEVGPREELWKLLRRGQRWVVERADPGGAVARWDEPSALRSSEPLELVVDGDGRAWLVPEAAEAPLCHKGPQSDWATISTWQREGEAHEALAAASDGRDGVWILTEAELLHVDVNANIRRLSLPDRGHWQAADLAINEAGEAVVRDAACFLDLYSLRSTKAGPESLGQYYGYACGQEPMVLALDTRRRTWLRTSRFEASVWMPEGSEIEVESPPEVKGQELGELIAVVVVGAGPALDIHGESPPDQTKQPAPAPRGNNGGHGHGGDGWRGHEHGR